MISKREDADWHQIGNIRFAQHRASELDVLISIIHTPDLDHFTIDEYLFGLGKIMFLMETMLTSSAIDSSQLIDALNWRYATKIFDDTKNIPDETIKLVLDVLRLSPSSIGLQPWKFVLIENQQTRSRIQNLSLHQLQITAASHLLLLCSFNDMDETHIDKLISYDRDVCKNERSAYADFRPHAIAYIQTIPKPQLQEWMAEQVYIALGFLLSACALLRIDACPIEAFDREKTNQLLELDKYGISSRTLVALGYRSTDDEHAGNKKVRFPIEELLIRI